MANNVLAPSSFTTLLVADTTAFAGGSPDSVQPWPTVTVSGVSYPAAGCAAFLSTSGGVILPNMTQAQINALPLTGQKLMPGTMVFNLTTDSMNVYTAAGTWSSVVDLTVSGTLTAAQLIAIYATPLNIVAAPPLHFAAIVTGFTLNYIYGSAAFTTGGNIGVQYGNTANLGGTAASAVIAAAALEQTHNTFSSVGVAAISNVASSVINSGTTTTSGLYLSNDTAAFAVGTGCTVNYSVKYKIVPVL